MRIEPRKKPQASGGTDMSEKTARRGRAAIKQGFSVRFSVASRLMTILMRSCETDQWQSCRSNFGKPQLLIVNKFG